MKPILFIDRDGTLIKEPPGTLQIDRLEQLEFLPGVLNQLYRISSSGKYHLVMVTNQDGLGSAGYPEAAFEQVQGLLMHILSNAGIVFQAVHVDRSRKSDNLPTRKPGTAMLTAYLQGGYDIANSYVLGDRLTDVELAANLGCRAILIKGALDDGASELNRPLQELEQVVALHTDSWQEIANFLAFPPRAAHVQRKTAETDIVVELYPDTSSPVRIATGLGFFDHMLHQIAKHANMGLVVQCDGDLHVDEHHTIEDTALAMGEAFAQLLEDRSNLSRYGFFLPMDDCSAKVAIDLGGRPWLNWKAQFKREKIGDVPTEMFMHFFKSFTDTCKCNLYIEADGENEHHKIESIFKAFARSLHMALKRNANFAAMPSTKEYFAS